MIGEALFLLTLASFPSPSEIDPISPPTLPNAAIVLDAASRSSLLASADGLGGAAPPGTPVLRWRPLAGPAFLGGPATLTENKAGAWLSFSASMRSGSTVTVGSAMTLMVAFRAPKVATGDQTILQLGTTDGGFRLRFLANGRLAATQAGSNLLVSQRTIPADAACLATLKADGTTVRLSLNGTSDRVGSGSIASTGLASVGGRFDDETFAGGIGYVAAYNRVLDDYETGGVEKWIAARTGVAWRTTYVSTQRGQTNAGIFPEAPESNLWNAIQRSEDSGGGTVLVEAPADNPVRGQITLSGAGNVTLAGWNGPWNVRAGECEKGGWTKTGISWSKPIDAPVGLRCLWLADQSDEGGDPTLLRRSSAAPSLLPPGYFTVVSGTAWLRLPDDGDPNTHRVEVGRLGACVRILSGGWEIRDAVLWGGSTAALDAPGGSLRAVNCDLKAASVGLRAAGVGTSVDASGCRAITNRTDGFLCADGASMRIASGGAEKNGLAGVFVTGPSTVESNGAEFSLNTAEGGRVETGGAFVALDSVFANNEFGLWVANGGHGESKRSSFLSNAKAGFWREDQQNYPIVDPTTAQNGGTDR